MFYYDKAFSRNIGWISAQEQATLKSKRVAIAGAGGVGGEYVVTLARLGIENFQLADFDDFEIHNFNRQAGAFMSTLGRAKCEVMHDVLKDINPNAKATIFAEGVFAHNVDQFLHGADIYVDSLDFFALDARKVVFQKCLEKNIPVVTAAPLGMGCAILCFMPGGMSYEQYFRFEECKSADEQYIKFLIGLSPSMLQRDYLVDPSKADFKAKTAPSMPMAVKMCAGIAGSYVLKILLKRGEVLQAPWGMHFDAYKNKFKKTWRPWGNANPIQRIMFKIAKKIVLK